MIKNKEFWLWSAVFLWIWSMVWAWIFVLLWEAWNIAWNLVFYSFIIWWIVALLSWYSLAKLWVAYPSRWWIVEYLVQCYWEWTFSWTTAILFYISWMISISMVAKTFWTYTSVLFWLDWLFYSNLFAIWVLWLFTLINLAWSKFITKSENIIVVFKLMVIILFTIVISFFIKPELLSVVISNHITSVLWAVWLTFFAYEWFRVITNTAEDMKDPSKLMLKSMIISIVLVMILYVFVAITVFWNLNIDQIIKAQDYALAEAAKPVFWQIWFTIMAIAALVSTSSSINANLYSIANTTYDMAKNWELPKEFERWVFHSTEWLIISSILISVMILFFDLWTIASVWAISMLFIHLIVHIWHFRIIRKTKASKFLVWLAIIVIIATIILASNYSSNHIDNFWIILWWSVFIAFLTEMILKFFTWRVINRQI